MRNARVWIRTCFMSRFNSPCICEWTNRLVTCSWTGSAYTASCETNHRSWTDLAFVCRNKLYCVCWRAWAGNPDPHPDPTERPKWLNQNRSHFLGLPNLPPGMPFAIGKRSKSCPSLCSNITLLPDLITGQNVKDDGIFFIMGAQCPVLPACVRHGVRLLTYFVTINFL